MFVCLSPDEIMGQRGAAGLSAVCPTPAGCHSSPLCVSLQTEISDRTETLVTLALFNVTEEDGGKYGCRAVNFVGKSENSFWLFIKSGKGPQVHPCTQKPAPSTPFLVGLDPSPWLPLCFHLALGSLAHQ